MSISLEQLKELRDATGVSIMACKKALVESDGDFDDAVDILRKKGEAKAADRAGRSTGEGVIAVAVDGSKAAIVKLACETDFVSMGDDFNALAQSLVSKVLSGEIDDSNYESLTEVTDAGLKLGENIKLLEIASFEGVVGSYVHSNKKIGVLVALDGGSEDLAKDIAMHVAATNPRVLSPDEIDEALLNKEKEIWTEQLLNEGKPAEIISKIMIGKENKFRNENALLKQPFVKNSDVLIEKLLENDNASVKGFVRFSI